MRAALAWLSSDRGLLVVGTSLVLGGLAFLWIDCVRMWRIRRKGREAADLAATTVFTALILGSALAMHAYGSFAEVTVGLATASLSGFGLREALRLIPAKGNERT